MYWSLLQAGESELDHCEDVASTTASSAVSVNDEDENNLADDVADLAINDVANSSEQTGDESSQGAKDSNEEDRKGEEPS